MIDMLTCSRNGRTVAGTDLRADDTAPGMWSQITTGATDAWNRITGGLSPNQPQPQDTATTDPNEPGAWNQITNAAGAAWDTIAASAAKAATYGDLQTCQSGYNNCVATSNACTAYVGKAATDVKWSLTKPYGIAIAAGGTILGTLIGVAIGRSTKHTTTATMGRRRRRR